MAQPKVIELATRGRAWDASDFEAPYKVPLGRNGALGTIDFDPARLSREVVRYLWEYGIRQCVNDSIAEKKDPDTGVAYATEVLRARALKRRDALYAGLLRVRAQGNDRVPLDPFDAECYVVAMGDLAIATKRGVKDAPKGTKDPMLWLLNSARVKDGKSAFADRGELFDEYMRGPRAASVRARAEENMKTRDGVDLGELGL